MKRSSALAVQARVIFAVIMREVSIRYGRQRLGYVWAIIEPLVYIMSVLVIYSVMGRKVHSGLPLVPFVISAIIPFFTFRNTAQRVMMISHNNKAILAYPQIKVMDIMIARTFLEIVNAFAVFAILNIGAVMLGFAFPPDNLLGAISAIFLAAFMGMCIGCTLNVIGQITTMIEKILPPILRVSILLSGLFYTAEELPLRLREIALMNPIFHIIEFSRENYFSQLNTYSDISFVVLVSLPFLFFGLLAEKSVSRQSTLE